MKVDRVEGVEVRQVLTAMIVDAVALARIAAQWKPPGLFASSWTNLVGSWCVEFHTAHKMAPGAKIEHKFAAWAGTNKDEATVTAVEKFLQGLSREYAELAKDSNPEYTLKLAERHFAKVRLKQLVEEVQLDLDEGAVEKAEERVRGSRPVQLAADKGTAMFSDQQAVYEALNEERRGLFTFPGDLGRFFGDEFERDSFVVFMGPEKRGKTFWLLETVWQALQARRKVVFFAVGDMTRNQVIRRMATRIARHPVRARTVVYPREWTRVEGKVVPRHEAIVYDTGLSWQVAWKALQEAQRTKFRTKEELFKMFVYPSSTLTIEMIDAHLETMALEGWTADVVVIDYMDNLRESGSGRDEARHRINATWKEARGLSQKWHIALVSATQANAESYTKHTMDMTNFSEDKRKLAHVTGMVGLNQDSEEKKAAVMRLGWVVLREDDFAVDRCVWVAQCLALAAPAVKSTFQGK